MTSRAFVVALVVGAAAASSRGQSFRCDFEAASGHAAGAPLAGAADWIADPDASASKIVALSDPATQALVVPLDLGGASAWLEPARERTALHWPFERTSGRFLRVEFALGIDEGGRFALDFTPAAAAGDAHDSLPRATVEIAWTGPQTATARVVARGGGDEVPVGPALALGPFPAGVLRRFRVDFAWDWFLFPGTLGGDPAKDGTRGLAWTDLRVAWLGVDGWVHPVTTAGSNGWLEFGEASLAPRTYGRLAVRTLGFGRDDWPASAAGGRDVRVRFRFESAADAGAGRRGLLDDVAIGPVTPPPFSLMANQIGYDTAGPQWVAMRPNDPLVRRLGAGAIAELEWTLRDASGAIQRRFTAPPAPRGEACFAELVDDEAPATTAGARAATEPICWWRWEWPPVTTDAQGWFVVAEGRLSSGGGAGAAFRVESDRFDVRPHLWFTTLVTDPDRNLAWRNARDREAVTTPWSQGPDHRPDPGGGWFDAGNENGECRAHATFVSALSNLLRGRRAELSSRDERELRRQIALGADYLMQLGSGRTDGSLLHEPPTRSCGGGDPRDARRGPGAEAADPDETWMACAALADASRTLAPLGEARAAAWLAQAQATRQYLRSLAGSSRKPPDAFVTNRAQALVDLLIHASTHDPAGLDAARAELSEDLIRFPPTSPEIAARCWTLAGLFRRQLDTPAYCAIEPLLLFIEDGVADRPQGSHASPSWSDALAAVCANGYRSRLLGPSFSNPLRIGWVWNDGADFSTPPDAFFGQQAYLAKKFAAECLETARLASTFALDAPERSDLVHLAVGNLNWLLGIHVGISSRHVRSLGGAADADLAHAGASFVNGVGRHCAMQVVQGLHAWTQPTLFCGVGSRSLAGFSYSRGDYTTSESFLKHDGQLLMALEAIDRALHPFLVVDAKAAGRAFVKGDALSFARLVPPGRFATDVARSCLHRVRLRASNGGGETTAIRLAIAQGATATSRTLCVPPTGGLDEFVVVDDGSGFSLPLASGTEFSIECTLLGPGPCAIDAIVVDGGGAL